MRMLATSAFVPLPLATLYADSSRVRLAESEGLTMAFEMQFVIELDREEDGRWIAEIAALPGVMVYAAERDDAIEKVKNLAIEVLQWDVRENGD